MSLVTANSDDLAVINPDFDPAVDRTKHACRFVPYLGRIGFGCNFFGRLLEATVAH